MRESELTLEKYKLNSMLYGTVNSFQDHVLYNIVPRFVFAVMLLRRANLFSVYLAIQQSATTDNKNVWQSI